MNQKDSGIAGSYSRVAQTVCALPPGVWALGFGSLFMDMSSELVHSLLPVFMASVLGAGMATIGLVEGAAEATAAVAKVFSGKLSDYLGRRKFLVVLGYGLAAVSKPVFPLAADIGWVFGARFVDRLGKGIRGAPRDALVADITPPALRGAAYGLRQALVLADIVLALAAVPWHVFVGALLWGLHMGLTQGLFAKLVADAAPVELRGTAFGIFNLISGAALLLASVMAGILWDRFGVQAAFIAGACFAALATAGIVFYSRLQNACGGRKR